MTPITILSRYLSNVGLKIVFGETMHASKENAEEAARLRPVHYLTVYFIANDLDQLETIASLWKDIPCRLIQLQPNDFFAIEQGRDPDMGIDRLATLRCAGCTYGFPVLVIDGGACLTHTLADEGGNIVGGGMCLGFGPTLNSIANRVYTPLIEIGNLINEAHNLVLKQEFLNPFPNNTTQAILTEVMGQITSNLRRVIKEYVMRVGESEEMEEDGSAPKPRNVVVAGGDEFIIKELLEPNAGLFRPDESMPKYKLHSMKHVIALGVSFILQEEVEMARSKGKGKHGELMRLLLGKRVAKSFLDGKGNSRIFRGSIMAVSDEADGTFFGLIRYDDDDVEELVPGDLYGKSAILAVSWSFFVLLHLIPIFTLSRLEAIRRSRRSRCWTPKRGTQGKHNQEEGGS